MPYTKNTRIKVVHKRDKDVFTAQVEYKFPIIGFSEWHDIADFEHFCVFRDIIGIQQNAIVRAHAAATTEDYRANGKYKGLEWAKLLIDSYHNILNGKEHIDTVEYIKYP